MGFAQRFRAGADAAGDILDTYNKAKQQAEFDKIMQAKAEQSQELTPEQAAALGQSVASGGVPTWNEANKSYSVETPLPDGQQGPVEPQNFAMQGVTNFLGQSTPGTMNESQVNNARMRALSGVISKTDPLTGMRMANDVTQAERADTRFGQETEMFNLNKSAAERAAEKDKLEMAKAAAGQHIQDVLKKNGGDVRKTAAQIMTETNAGGLEGVKVDYEVGRDGKGYFAKTLPDGTRDVGQPIEPGAQGDLSVWQGIIGGISDPKTVMSWYTDKLTRERDDQRNTQHQANADRGYALQVNADNRAGAAAGQAASDRAMTKKEKEAAATAGVNLYKQQNPNATSAELEAVRTGVLKALPSTDANAPSEVKLAQAFMNAGLETNMADALKRATQSKGKSTAELRADIYGKALASNMGNAETAQKVTEQAMQYLDPAKASPAAVVSEFSSPADAEAAVKAGKIKAGDRVKIAGRVAVWKP